MSPLMEIAVIQDATPVASYRFDQSTVRIGRHPDNDIVLDAPHVSAHHGRIEASATGLCYEDLKTTNGSFLRRGQILIAVDGSRDHKVTVENEDVLFLGEPALATCLQLRRLDGAADEAFDGEREQQLIEVLTRVEVKGDGAVRRLAEGFDREALLALHDYNSVVTRLRSEPQILAAFGESMLSLYRKATNVSVYLIDGTGEDLKPALMLNRDGDVAPQPLSRTLRRSLHERRQALTFAATEPEFDSAVSLNESAVQAGMCAPMWRGERLTGVVQVDCRGERRLPFDQRDVEVLVVFSSMLAVAVENIRLKASLEGTIADLRRVQTEMEILAFRDPLTELSNRRLLRDRLDQAVKLSRRERRAVSLLYLDLDHFKRVNDTFGHDSGDLLLKAVANRLRSCVRAQDTVARIGGDEFAAVLFDVAGAAGARTVARKILEVLRQPIQLPKHSITATASIGIALAPSDGIDAPELLRKADLAMYRAKSHGRDNFQFFTDDMNRDASQRLFLESELRQALVHNQFTEYFQPVVRASDLRVVGLEALVRWNHPERGLTAPGHFIDVAEETGLIVSLGHRVLQSACEQAQSLQSTLVEPLRIAVNLSARQFTEARFPELVRRVLEETALEPRLLELELTESMLMEDTQEALDRLHELKRIGITLCIDDFGTGYSSLSYLKRFPVDVLKIDRSFVQGIPHDSSDVEIAAAVIAMAHKLNIEVVAEGVETPAQLEFLRANGCDYFQGFFFSEPLPIADLSLRDKKR